MLNELVLIAELLDGARPASDAPSSAGRDPVCGMAISDPDAPAVEHAGVRYRFCSQTCRARFLQAPGRFFAAPALA